MPARGGIYKKRLSGSESGVFRRVLAVDEVALELLIARGFEQAAGFASLPADDLVGLAAEMAALFPAGGPGAIGVNDAAVILVEVESLALSIGLHAQVHRGDGGVAQVGRAEGFRVA